MATLRGAPLDGAPIDMEGQKMAPRVTLTPVDPEDLRHQQWADAAGSRARAVRDRRLQTLQLREAAIRAGIEKLAREHQESGGLSPAQVLLRPALVHTPAATDREDSDPALSPIRESEHPGMLASTIRKRVAARPPLGQLVHRSGAAAPLLMAALGVAAFRSTPGEEVDLSDIPNTGRGSWAKLIGDADSPDHARRHVVDGVKRLRGLDLLSLKAPISKNPGFDGWGLLTEDGQGDTYTVPRAGIDVPSGFWLNGWSQVLTPPEVLAYLMIRHLAVTYPAAHRERGVGAAPSVRRQQYGVTKTAYATLNELEEFGLLRRTTPRQPGTVRDDSPRMVDRFELLDVGPSRNAFDKVKSVCVERPTPARMARYDPDRMDFPGDLTQ